jgi:orotidine-5'-phosphate decarboxylase
MKFPERLLYLIKEKNSVLCVGLDPDLAKIPQLFNGENEAETVYNFCKAVIEATKSQCIAYKPNLAFFEALGEEGLAIYHRIIHAIPDTHLVVSDAKRGDIGNTAAHYEKAIFGHSKADAITVNPLMGFDSVEPYGKHEDKAVFGLAYTSNKGAEDFFAQSMADGKSLSVHIADKLAQWNSQLSTHIGMVVGATQAKVIQPVLAAHPKACLLIPGIGAQGGSVQELAEVLAKHKAPVLINSSRAIIYAANSATNLGEWKNITEDAAKKTNIDLVPITQFYA